MNKLPGKNARRVATILFFFLSVAIFTNAQIITTIAGTGTAGYSGDGGAATAASLNLPYGVAVDSIGNVYIADCSNHRVRKISPSGVITTIAGTGGTGYGGDGGAATTAPLDFPIGIAVDNSGNVYISDRDQARVRKVNTAGVISTIAGSGTAGYSGDGGAATAADLRSPHFVAVDGRGCIYISELGNSRIRMVDTAGIITTIAGNGVSGYSGDGGPATAAKINPLGVAVDGSGQVYIADFINNRIRKVDTSGVITTFAGTGIRGYSGDSSAATAATLYNPNDIAVDGSGNVYITDFNNNVIRKVNTAGIITSVAGTGIRGYSGDGGAATAAYLSGPEGVAVDGSGNIYVTDVYNNRIRKIACLPVIAPVVGPSSLCTGSSITLTDSTPGGTWISSNPTMASISTTGIVSAISANTGAILYIVSNLCGSDTAIHAITVNPLPDAGTIAGSDSLCIADTTIFTHTAAGGTWQSTNTTVASINTSGKITALSTGVTDILYIVSDSCGSDTAQHSIRVRTPESCLTGISVQTNTGNDRMNIAPNPNNGTFLLSLSSTNKEQTVVTVTNMLGEKVRAFTMQNTTTYGKEATLSLDVPPGIYIVAAVTGSDRVMARLVVGQ